ncbi:MAG: AI-2E family transporter [Alphaproteobacteria bacterium]|nr:AI-2E family transporter [Alphaproteobacteria bacterium]
MNWILIAMLSIGILKFGQSLIAPLLVAVFIWYLLNAVAAYYKKILPESYRNGMAANIASIIASVGTFAGFVLLFSKNVRPVVAQFQQSLPLIQERITSLLTHLAQQLDITLDFTWLPDMQRLAMSIGSSVASLATSIGIISIYVLFMFIEQGTFKNKMKNLFASEQKYEMWNRIISKIHAAIKKYLFVKTAISLATGLASYALMAALGLEMAMFWAFLIFILNYIPTFGSIVAVTLPVAYAFASMSVGLAAWITAGLIAMQILFSNIIEPKLMGKTLNLSTLAILVNLVFWGMLWGAVGMFFSVPLLVGAFIITSHLKSTRRIAVLLSADGRIPEIKEDEPIKKKSNKLKNKKG